VLQNVGRKGGNEEVREEEEEFTRSERKRNARKK
jgi:hypothetical protein